MFVWISFKSQQTEKYLLLMHPGINYFLYCLVWEWCVACYDLALLCNRSCLLYSFGNNFFCCSLVESPWPPVAECRLLAKWTFSIPFIYTNWHTLSHLEGFQGWGLCRFLHILLEVSAWWVENCKINIPFALSCWR